MKVKGKEAFIKAKGTNIIVDEGEKILRMQLPSGAVVYAKEKETISCPPFSAVGIDSGKVTVGGETVSAADIRIFIQLYEGMLKQTEELQDLYKFYKAAYETTIAEKEV